MQETLDKARDVVIHGEGFESLSPETLIDMALVYLLGLQVSFVIINVFEYFRLTLYVYNTYRMSIEESK